MVMIALWFINMQREEADQPGFFTYREYRAGGFPALTYFNIRVFVPGPARPETPWHAEGRALERDETRVFLGGWLLNLGCLCSCCALAYFVDRATHARRFSIRAMLLLMGLTGVLLGCFVGVVKHNAACGKLFESVDNR